MNRYIARTCPRCQKHFCVTISHSTHDSRELPISGWCTGCGYALKGWRVIVRRKQRLDVRFGRMRKVFTR
jgi:hypothetical protein